MTRRRFLMLSTTMAVFAAWIVGVWWTYGEITTRTNRSQLQSKAEQVLGRAERTLDLVVTAQAQTLVAGGANCTPGGVRGLQQVVYGVASLADLLHVTEAGYCSAFEGLSPPPPSADERAGWSAARNEHLRIGFFDQEARSVMAISWEIASGQALIGVVDTEALLFDVLPPPLRRSAEVSLRLRDGRPVARFLTADAAARALRGLPRETFAAVSERYPLRVEIDIDRKALVAWRHGAPDWLVALGGLLGLGIGVVVAKAVFGRADLEREAFDRAVRVGEVTAYFQPIIDLQTGALTGCEALARWVKPSGEMISPARFIPMVERTGRADMLLERVLAEAGRSLGPALERIDRFRLGVNVTAQQFADADFAPRFLARLERCGLKPTHMTVEVTERQALEHAEVARATSAALMRAGVLVAIDDAGTGHNGLSAMQTLNAQCLKIDKYFVDQLPENRRSRIMVDLLVNVAREFGMKSVAEGVETPTQAEALRRAGVDAGQGFLYAAAEPGDVFRARLEDAAMVRNSNATAAPALQTGEAEALAGAASADAQSLGRLQSSFG